MLTLFIDKIGILVGVISIPFCFGSKYVASQYVELINISYVWCYCTVQLFSRRIGFNLEKELVMLKVAPLMCSDIWDISEISTMIIIGKLNLEQ